MSPRAPQAWCKALHMSPVPQHQHLLAWREPAGVDPPSGYLLEMQAEACGRSSAERSHCLEHLLHSGASTERQQY